MGKKRRLAHLLKVKRSHSDGFEKVRVGRSKGEKPVENFTLKISKYRKKRFVDLRQRTKNKNLTTRKTALNERMAKLKSKQEKRPSAKAENVKKD